MVLASPVLALCRMLPLGRSAKSVTGYSYCPPLVLAEGRALEF